MQKHKKGFFQKFLALMLSIAMVVGAVPVTSMAAEGVTEKVADTSTIDGWENYFTEGSTEFAGGVWTDKSVFTDAEAFADLPEVQMVNEDNFLVSLSALASNKEIVGYSTIPTDTILILDLSQSMDNGQSIPQTVSAANDAIKRLLELNLNNRVGVVLYSGNSELGSSRESTGTLLLELNRYTANDDGQYITYSGNAGDTTVSIASGLKIEGSEAEINTQGKIKRTEGGTYIQNGLNIAMDEFLDADPIITGVNVQKGVTRMPIFVLMSDGAPTAGTTNYAPAENEGVGTSNFGNGGSTSAGFGFATQLTAAYSRAMVDAHYVETTPKFYTLGLDLSERDSDGQYVAESVLNPANSLSAINTYWDELFEDGEVTFRALNNNVTIERPTSQGNYTDMLVRVWDEATQQYTENSQLYVDRYFEAENNDDLNAAFTDIVNEIIIQSAYYPTLVEDGEHDLDGYVTFEDEIGLFMEVKNITGIVLGDEVFTGEALVDMMKNTDLFGDRYTFTELGWELVESLAERIGCDEAQAIELLQNAWADGQLAYENDNNFSNYIGWYEGENGAYVGYWNDEHTETDAPTNAKYISKSYVFYGSTREEGEILGGDMMHVIVKVRTEIATGHQDVVFEIPSSLIPVVTYHVEIEGESLENPGDITLERDGKEPIRLLFEVGVRSDINELNVAEIMEGQHVHTDENGAIYFYTNQWGSLGENHDEVDYSNPFEHITTESKFEASVENERYYYTDDTPIYVNVGSEANPEYELYDGDSKPSGDGYYHAFNYFEGDADSAEMKTKYIPISVETLAAAAQSQEDGSWYIPEGNVYQELGRFVEQAEKGEENNKTETLEYFNYPVVVHPEGDDAYEVYAFLGNNGRLALAPATGIKLTKLVDDTVTDSDAVFTFNVSLADANGASISGKYTLVDASGKYTEIEFVYGVSEDIEMKAGEVIYIIGLPAGTKYTVTENNENVEYTVGNVTIDGNVVVGKEAEGTITSNKLEDIVFTNTERKEGSLIIRKNVTHDFESDPEALAGKEFTILVTLTDANGPVANTEFTTADGETVKTDENGVITLTLSHNESVTITGIEADIQYTVSEKDNPAGFTLVTEAANLTGTIVADTDSVVTVINDYNPAPVPAAIPVNVTKTLEGHTWDEGIAFEFQLEKLNADGSWSAVGEAVEVTSSTPFTFTIPKDSLTAIGTYDFRVRELNPNAIPGITSDAARYFRVTVTDSDMDGKLEISSITGTNITSNGQNVDMSFVNTYTTLTGTTVNIPIEKRIQNNSNVNASLEGFEFVLSDGTTEVKATTNVAGDATIHLTYSAEDFEEWDTNDDNKHEFVYTLKETKGSATGMDYSGEVYTVKVLLESIGSELQATVTIVNSAGESVDLAEVVFTNVLEDDVVWNPNADANGLNVEKNMEGRPLEAGEFQFQLIETGNDFVIPTGATVVSTGTNAADGDGSVTFDKSVIYTKAGTYYYVLKEAAWAEANGVEFSTQEYYVTVVVGQDANYELTIDSVSVVKPGSGVVDNTAENPLEFTNTYKVEPISVKFDGTKELTGRTLGRGEFTFNLYEVIDGEEKFVTSTTNTATGAFSFEISYDAAGDHSYVIREDASAELPGVTYDDSYFTFHVKVTDNNDGNLITTDSQPVKVDGETETPVDVITFNNSYKAAPAEITLNAVKLLENMDLEDDAFKFELYAADEEFNTTGNALYTVTNNEDGAIQFDFEEEVAGTYYYVLKESAADPMMDVVYDTKEYHITIVVYDQGGQLSSRVTCEVNGEEIDDLVFSNVYREPTPAEVTIEAVKNLAGRPLKAGEFSFELYETEADFSTEGREVLKTQTNAADGKVAFEALSYSVDKLDGETEKDFYYVVKEVIPTDKAGVTYDDSYFQITVHVKNPGNGALEAAITNITEADGEDADTVDTTVVFNNTYDAANAKVTLGGTKVLEGKDLTEGDFTFALYAADEEFNATGNALQTVTNGANGKYAFAAIEYKLSDLGADGTETYYYVIEEVPGEDIGETDGKVDYDETRHTIKVVVSDDGKGAVVMDVTYDNGKTFTQTSDVNVSDLDFTNSYNPTDAVVNLGGTKALKGRTLKDGEFTFELYEGDELLQTKTNINGAFAFDSLTYDEEGTYSYVVKEVIPEDTKGVDYDTTEYQVKVVVKNDKKGELKATVSVNGKEVVEDKNFAEYKELDFENSYTAELPDDVGLTITGQKTLTGDRDKAEKGEFTFVLSEVVIDATTGEETVEEIERVKNDADGTFTFETIDTYTEAGVHYYRVTEVIEDEVGMTYDETVYDIEVSIEDDGEGNLVINPVIKANGDQVEAIEFVNTYLIPEPIEVSFNITKILKNETEEEIGLDGFEFKLKEGFFKSETVKSDENGIASFTKTYTMEDIGKTFEYVISEVDTKVEGMEYDNNKVKVSVTISEQDGKLVATLTQNDEEVETVDAKFTNTYVGKGPVETGDNANTVLYIVISVISLAVIVVLFFRRRMAR